MDQGEGIPLDVPAAPFVPEPIVEEVPAAPVEEVPEPTESPATASPSSSPTATARATATATATASSTATALASTTPIVVVGSEQPSSRAGVLLGIMVGCIVVLAALGLVAFRQRGSH